MSSGFCLPLSIPIPSRLQELGAVLWGKGEMQSQHSQVDMVHSHRDRKTRSAVVRAWVTQEGREREQPPHTCMMTSRGPGNGPGGDGQTQGRGREAEVTWPVGGGTSWEKVSSG